MDHNRKTLPSFIINTYFLPINDIKLMINKILNGENVNYVKLICNLNKIMYCDPEIIHSICLLCIKSTYENTENKFNISMQDDMNMIDEIIKNITFTKKILNVLSNYKNKIPCPENRMILCLRDEHKTIIYNLINKLKICEKITNINELVKYCKIAKYIYYVLQKDNKLNIPDYVIEYLINHMSLIDRQELPTVIKIMQLNNSFIIKYKKSFNNRLTQDISNDQIMFEKEVLAYFYQNNDSNKKIIQRMNKQIDNLVESIEFTKIFRNNMKIIPESNKYKEYIPDNKICNFMIRNKHLWDCPIVHQDTIVCDMSIYDDAFRKIYGCVHEHDEIMLDTKKSTGVINITIMDNDYNFFATMQQINIIIYLINNKHTTFDQILNSLKMDDTELEIVLNSLVECDLVKCEKDYYYMNNEFFFEENSISLVGMLLNNVKFDEILILNIVDIITNNKCENATQICDVYAKKYGFANMMLINSILEYLEKKNIIEHTGIYIINTKTLDDFVELTH